MKKKTTIKLFLADLGHTYFNISPSTVPIGVSYIKAMLQERFKKDLEISIFRYPAALLKAVKSENPDIVGFGIYLWNENLSLWCAKAIRNMYPDIMLVAGGLNIPNSDEGINANYIGRYGALFNAYIPYEGELPMVQLIERTIGSDSEQNLFSRPIAGCYTYHKGKLLKGELIPFIKDVDDIPSPYLTGVVDELLDDPLLMPVIQTMRGCPYRCSYCVSGDKAYSKIRPFSLERAKDEIRYIKRRAKNRSLRITDDNFGMLDRDIELAEFIGRLHAEEGYPHALKVYTDKAANDRVKKVMLSLKELIPYNVSFQSTTPEVLKTIGRINTPADEISKAFRWAKNNNILTGTEILHGFPGETYETFTKCVTDVYELRVDSVGCHEVWLLPNTELASNNNREINKFESMFTLGADALSVIDGELICECEEHLISSKFMTAEEHYQLCAMDFYVALTLANGYLRELAYHGLTYGIKPVKILNEILSSPARYPVMNKLFTEYVDKVKGSYFKSPEDVRKHVKSIIDSEKAFPPTRFMYVLIGEFVFGDNFAAGVDEYINAMRGSLDEKGEDVTRDFEAVSRELKKLAVKMVINPEKLEPQNIEIQLDYDVPKWINDCYMGRLSDYRRGPVLLRLSVPSLSHLNGIYEAGKKLRSSSERKQYFFRHTNSSGIRRRINYKDEHKPLPI